MPTLRGRQRSVLAVCEDELACLHSVGNASNASKKMMTCTTPTKRRNVYPTGRLLSCLLELALERRESKHLGADELKKWERKHELRPKAQVEGHEALPQCQSAFGLHSFDCAVDRPLVQSFT